MKDAVISMFAEYAVLYGRIAGWVTSSKPAPMTLDEAVDISKHAEEFVMNFMTPILGPVNTIKVHKLLRHVLDSIKMHGNLKNGNTSTNESLHKDDKKFYRRTNKSINAFTAQIVRLSQGTKEVLSRIDGEDAECVRLSSCVGAPTLGPLSGCSGTLHPPLLPRAPLARRNRLRLTVGDLSRRPGLAGLGWLLNRQAKFKVGVLHSKKIVAELECGNAIMQILRASSSFRGNPWYDAVMYDLNRGSASATAPGQDETATQHIGEVRAIINGWSEDLAVVCNMTPDESPMACPLSARECSRVKWEVPSGGEEWSITLVPLHCILRVVHVAPDFSHLTARRGPAALPPPLGGSLEELRGMRYFVNAFYPWG